MKHAQLEVLLVEDNPGDVRLVQEGLRAIGMDCGISVAEDGDRALQRLHDEARPLPDLVLLDLNLTRVDGRRVLTEIKRDPRLRHVPVVVLTSSDAERDIAAAFDLHANAYVKKPGNLAAFLDVIASIGHFWLETSELPPH